MSGRTACCGSPIDTASGELVAFDRGSGVALVDAVAASCAVPGAWPPVTIGDRRYMDGGVGSTINLALAGDCDVAVALVPAGRSAPSPFGGGGAAEIDAFRGSAFDVFADDESLTAFGANPLDPACRVPSARAGREQGRREPATLRSFSTDSWSSAGVAGFSRMSSARAASSCPTSMTSTARWNPSCGRCCAAPRSV